MKRLLVAGSGTKRRFLGKDRRAHFWQSSGRPWIEPAASDHVVTVSADCPLEELAESLSRHGQTLPLPPRAEFGDLVAGIPGTVGGLIAANLPHGLSSVCGGPREWLLQAEVWFENGPAKSGARVVKSVAGYDAHKLFVGSWGRLGPILSVTLRTRSKASVPVCQSVVLGDWDGGDVWIARCLPTEFDPWLERSQGLYAYDRASCTIWAGIRPDTPSTGWLLGPNGETWRSEAAAPVETRLKQVFDPSGQWA